MWSEKKAWSTSQWKTWWQKSRQKAEVMFSSLIPCQWTLNQHYRISKYTIWNRLVFTLLSLSVLGRSPKRTQSSKLYQIRPYQNVTLNVWIILPELIKQQQQIFNTATKRMWITFAAVCVIFISAFDPWQSSLHTETRRTQTTLLSVWKNAKEIYSFVYGTAVTVTASPGFSCMWYSMFMFKSNEQMTVCLEHTWALCFLQTVLIGWSEVTSHHLSLQWWQKHLVGCFFFCANARWHSVKLVLMLLYIHWTERDLIFGERKIKNRINQKIVRPPCCSSVDSLWGCGLHVEDQRLTGNQWIIRCCHYCLAPLNIEQVRLLCFVV